MVGVNLIRDISSKQAHQKKLMEYAFVDSLTQLPNRRYFDDDLRRKAAYARRHQEKLGILYMDLDGFKAINDKYGHKIGDLVLSEISSRLSKIARVEDVVARVGGDEFVLSIFPVMNSSYLDEIAHRILNEFKKPILIQENQFYISISIGLSLSETDSFDEQDLLKKADQAMFVAKRKGGNCFVWA